MRFKLEKSRSGIITGYSMWLSKVDTYLWATRPGKAWPCSTLRETRCVITVDSNGLCGLTVNQKYADENGLHGGIEVSGSELDAIVADHCPPEVQHLWPCWKSSEETTRGTRVYTLGGWQENARWVGDKLAYRSAPIYCNRVHFGQMVTGTGGGYGELFRSLLSKVTWMGRVPREFGDLWLVHDLTPVDTAKQSLEMFADRVESLLAWREKQSA